MQQQQQQLVCPSESWDGVQCSTHWREWPYTLHPTIKSSGLQLLAPAAGVFAALRPFNRVVLVAGSVFQGCVLAYVRRASQPETW